MYRYFVLSFICFVFFSAPLRAESRSVYTDVDVARCQVIEQAQEGDGEWAVFGCPGWNGMSVFITEADLRYSLGYGPNGRSQKSFSQFLSPFNTIGKKMEWRLTDGRLSATILRYFTQSGSGGKQGQILVVTKVAGRQACHVAYVDALANKGANQMAQFAADHIAPNFKCGSDRPIHIGKRGVSAF